MTLPVRPTGRLAEKDAGHSPAVGYVDAGDNRMTAGAREKAGKAGFGSQG